LRARLAAVRMRAVQPYMKKSSLGLPSSERRKLALENAATSCTSRVEADTLRFLKCGAQFESAIIRAG
jgi:hypothetical protein